VCAGAALRDSQVTMRSSLFNAFVCRVHLRLINLCLVHLFLMLFFAKEPYKRDNILQKRHTIFSCVPLCDEVSVSGASVQTQTHTTYIHTMTVCICVVCASIFDGSVSSRSLLQNIVSFVGLFRKKRPIISMYACLIDLSCTHLWDELSVSHASEMIGLFCERALQKRLYPAKETYNFKEPPNRSHPRCITCILWSVSVSCVTQTRSIYGYRLP